MTDTVLGRLADRLRRWEDHETERNRERLRSGGGPADASDGKLGGRGVLIWLVLLIWPITEAVHGRHGPLWLALGGMALFVVLFLALRSARQRGRFTRYPLLAALVALGLLLSGQYGGSGYFLVILSSMATTMVLPVVRPAFAGLVLVTGLAMTVTAVGGGDTGDVLNIGFSAFMSGFVVFILRRLFTTIALLRQAREDLARAAVADERLRFARDLHDLLGHSLSLIVVKAEVVRKLAARDPAAAAAAAADIESVGRQALTEVREAVTGYRQQDLSGELDGARAALADGGVETTVRLSAGPLGAHADALLGWAVREGTTNVLRHSRARHCTIALRRDGDTAVLTITDDGTGGPAAPAGGTGSAGNTAPTGSAGNGLRGLTERFAAAGGTVTAAPTGTGFVLTASVPVDDATTTTC